MELEPHLLRKGSSSARTLDQPIEYNITLTIVLFPDSPAPRNRIWSTVSQLAAASGVASRQHRAHLDLAPTDVRVRRWRVEITAVLTAWQRGPSEGPTRSLHCERRPRGLRMRMHSPCSSGKRPNEANTVLMRYLGIGREVCVLVGGSEERKCPPRRTQRARDLCVSPVLPDSSSTGRGPNILVGLVR